MNFVPESVLPEAHYNLLAHFFFILYNSCQTLSIKVFLQEFMLGFSKLGLVVEPLVNRN